MSHNWSGWPGAWCLDCGVDNVLEVALGCAACDYGDGELCERHREHPGAKPCASPGSGRFNPYIKPALPSGEHQ